MHQRQMWFITKLLDTKANHNTQNEEEEQPEMWFITKLLDTKANHNESFTATYSRDWCDLSRNYLIRKQITTIICLRLKLQGCDLSRNYLIRKQITTWACGKRIGIRMWLITKLLGTTPQILDNYKLLFYCQASLSLLNILCPLPNHSRWQGDATHKPQLMSFYLVLNRYKR